MTAATSFKIHPNRLAYIDTLIDEVVQTEDERKNWKHHVRLVTSDERFEDALHKLWNLRCDRTVSEVVDHINSRPNAYAKINQLGKKLPEGSTERTHYALPTDEEGGWNFYTVYRPVNGQGKPNGMTFVYVEASEETHTMGLSAQELVLETILEDVDYALTSYGLQLQHCGLCGRKLTNDESRARGIGPKCLGKM